MNRPLLIRALRITWTAICGLACVLLIALWWRSYSFFEFCQVPTSSNSSVHLQSAHGRLVIFALSDFHTLRVGSVPTPHVVVAGELSQPMTAAAIPGGIGFNVVPFTPLRVKVIPYWLVSLAGCILAAVAAMIPWWPTLGWQFSLRTLLIAITLIAMVLGTVVYLAR